MAGIIGAGSSGHRRYSGGKILHLKNSTLINL